jgi:hypothetical protein
MPDDELLRYLLGDLPEEEAERLDERSIVDDEFAVRLRIAEDDLVDAYARGRLTGDQLGRFEGFYLASPRRREQAMFAKRFVAAIDTNAGREEQARAVEPSRSRAWRLAWALAAAAALCLAFSAVLLRDARLRATQTETNRRLTATERRFPDLPGELAAERRATVTAENAPVEAREAQPVSIATFVLPPQTRGVGPLPVVALGSGSTTVTVAVAVVDAGVGYEAALKDPATNQIVWRSGPLAPDRAAAASLVAVALPVALLKPQHYVLDLFAVRGGRHFVDSYAFEVRR